MCLSTKIIEEIRERAETRLEIQNNHNGKAKLGCLIYRKGKGDVFCYGINRYNENYRARDGYPDSLHAEEAALGKLKKSEKPQKIIIVVYRINHNKKLCNSKPCDNCVKAIKITLIQKNYKLVGNKVWYTDKNGEFNFIHI